MFIEPPISTEKINELLDWCQKLQQRILEDDLKGSISWDPGSIVAGADEHKEVTVTGAALGDYAIASFSLDIGHLTLHAHVSSANTVDCQLYNHSGSPIDLGSGTLYVRVFKRTT